MRVDITRVELYAQIKHLADEANERNLLILLDNLIVRFFFSFAFVHQLKCRFGAAASTTMMTNHESMSVWNGLRNHGHAFTRSRFNEHFAACKNYQMMITIY